MKIRAITHRQVAIISVVYLALFGLLALLVHAADFGSAAAVFYIVMAVAWVYTVVRGFGTADRMWVQVDPSTVTWRSWTRKGQPPTATESGSVPTPAIASVAVVPAERTVNKRVLRGHAVALLMRDGRTVTLPLWTSATRTTPPVTALVAALKGACGPDVVVDTSAIDSVGVAAG